MYSGMTPLAAGDLAAEEAVEEAVRALIVDDGIRRARARVRPAHLEYVFTGAFQSIWLIERRDAVPWIAGFPKGIP